MVLESVFLAEFDNEAGLLVTCQAPENGLDMKIVDAISDTLVPKPELLGRSLSVHAFGKTFLGVAASVQGAHYARNKLIFNVGFVLNVARSGNYQETGIPRHHPKGSGNSVDNHDQTHQHNGIHLEVGRDTTHPELPHVLQIYVPMARKLALVLSEMEEETRFVSDSKNKPILQRVCAQVLDGLTKHGKCMVQLDSANRLYLDLSSTISLNSCRSPLLSTSSIHLFHHPFHSKEDNLIYQKLTNLWKPANKPSSLLPSSWLEINFSQVPVPIMSLDYVGRDQLWHSSDLALAAIIPLIDGVRHVQAIIEEADIDSFIAQQALMELVQFGAIILVDLFQYSNEYMPTHRLAEYMQDESMRLKCHYYTTRYSETLLSVEKRASKKQERETTEKDLLGLNLITLYSKLGGAVSVGSILADNMKCLDSRFDARRWVTFGIAYGIIRRIHLYPIYMDAPRNSQAISSDAIDSGIAVPRSQNEFVVDPGLAPSKHPPNGIPQPRLIDSEDVGLGRNNSRSFRRKMSISNLANVVNIHAVSPLETDGANETEEAAPKGASETNHSNLAVPENVNTNRSPSLMEMMGSALEDNPRCRYLTPYELALMDGRRAFDEICVCMRRSPADLLHDIQSHPQCVVIRKISPTF